MDVLEKFHLLIERGQPYENEFVHLKRKISIGRFGSEPAPGIAFHIPLVSRQHCVIDCEKPSPMLIDLGSKHGTWLNGMRLLPQKEYGLSSGDQITLVNGMISMKYITVNDQETMDWDPLKPFRLPTEDFIDIHELLQKVRVHQKDIHFSHKEFQCFKLLYSSLGQFVSKEEIKRHAWSERDLLDGRVPDVGSDELNSLIYRVRKKLSPYMHIESVLRKGFVMAVTKEI
ncbi:FHA domain-containing protein [Fictibacillus sp. KU28468]|uniref:FHA domain-containing protein n=1 Tax=Fictibacillus sp. KU28468 TaxID=2991053 RepID=UPI00223E4749|nr:FHA domain-containing protein [Fictibacillus sp. KU28468]UZJ78676.1 FHA domain-containing protein [Fictibacillus sp. KU28468]